MELVTKVYKTIEEFESEVKEGDILYVMGIPNHLARTRVDNLNPGQKTFAENANGKTYNFFKTCTFGREVVNEN